MKKGKKLMGTWNQMKGRLKQKVALYIENEPLLAEGKKDELIGRLQIKLGKTKEEIQKIISNSYTFEHSKK